MANLTDITSDVLASFRAKQLQFSDETTWPDNVITLALEEGNAETGGSRWGSYVDTSTNLKLRGMYLFASHMLLTTYPSGADGNTASGSVKFATASKSVGDESISFNTGSESLSITDAWLASTGYGIQFMRLRKRVGMGAIAV